jgi:DNA-binding NtrC family response regulator
MSTEAEERDDTQQDEPRTNGAPPACERPFLFVVLEADRPLAGGARFDLEGVDEVLVVRGSERGACRELRAGTRRLTLELPGRAVSARHASLRRDADGWLLDDLGSTNGSYVNGARVTSARLRPGDVLEIGRTFVLIEICAAPEATPNDLDVREELGDGARLPTLLPAIERNLVELRRIAKASLPVLIAGETGTGKELLARAVHAFSERKHAFVAVNCAALTENLVEAQLFGHVRGAFSGAVSDAAGFVRSADGGTLLLDEVHELRASAQAALLRVLQEGEVVPVGGVRPLAVDVRIVATSPFRLEQAVHRGSFRPDLFARLSGFSCVLTPLRERRPDLGLLIAVLLTRQGIGVDARPRIAATLAQRMLAHTWPLNVRELEQFLKRAWILSHGGLIDDPDFTPQTAGRAENRAEPLAHAEVLSEEQRELRDRLLTELERAGGNVAAVARSLDKAPMQVRRWLTRFGIDLEQFR